AIIATATKGFDRRILQAVPFDGSERTVFFADPQTEVARVETDPVSNAPTTITLGGLEEAVRFIDPDAERLQRKVEAAFPGKRVSVRDRSANGQRVIVDVSGPLAPSVYYLVDLGTGKADLVGEEYPALSRTELGAVRMIHYPSRDGAKVPAYLTLPPGSAGKGLPLVVLPHD